MEINGVWHRFPNFSIKKTQEQTIMNVTKTPKKSQTPNCYDLK
jgi:hypothetical protein